MILHNAPVPMADSLTPGTVLQKRYRLIRLLGQGGFARTYLAEDQGRFQEWCVLKEFTPSHDNAHKFVKARELFQREATILYQLQHPQIPQFRAAFEYDDPVEPRLFLVQDYVAGQTYQELLQTRKAQGQVFSEAEVVQLLRQLLPVLEFVHRQGMIHRDISPDNLILRDRDRLPVLIDFGVVKTVVTQLQQVGELSQGTLVGKPGYAPMEQLKTGQAYPSSDLYALAVTALVLLTGQEPQYLYQDTTATWEWQSWAHISPKLAQVLERMLADKPSDRFASAQAALQALPQVALTEADPPQLPQVPEPVARTVLPTSQIRTLAADRPELVQPSTQPVAPIPAVTKPARPPQQPDRLGAVVGLLLGVVLAGLVGLGTWLLVRSLLLDPATTVVTPAAPSTAPTPTPSTSPAQFSYTQTLSLVPGAEATVEGTLRMNEAQNYRISTQDNQFLEITLQADGISLEVIGPDLRPVRAIRRSGASSWEGVLPTAGDYLIRLRSQPGVTQSPYQLTVRLAEPIVAPLTPTPPEPSLSPEISPSLEPTLPPQLIDTITLDSAQPEQQLIGQLEAGQVQRYVISGAAGQVLSTQVLEGSVTLTVRSAAGEPLAGASQVLAWEGALPTAGEYQIDVTAINPTAFNLGINLTSPSEEAE